MGTLLVGLLLVTASAAGFGLALFGRRPVPQPAMAQRGTHLGDPDLSAPAERPDTNRPDPTGGRRSLRTRLPDAIQPLSAPHDDVTLPTWVRVRSALVLALTVVGLAGIIGGALSVVVVGLVLVVT